MSQLLPDQSAPAQTLPTASPARQPCPAPADFRAEVARYDDQAEYRPLGRSSLPHDLSGPGKGPPLILVPGIASTYRTYAFLLNRLGERFRTVRLRLPGRAPDDGADLARISHDHLVDDLFGLIDHLKIGRVFLVGVSFGSTIVLKALHREPRRFPKAAVQGAFAFRDFHSRRAVGTAVGAAGSGNRRSASPPPADPDL